MFYTIDEMGYSISANGEVKSPHTNKILKPGVDGCGYYSVVFCDNKKRITKKIHRLLAQMFIPNPDNKPEVNHIDGNKLNNDLSNLEWVTRKENVVHACETGLLKPNYGEKNGNSRLSDKEVKAIFYYSDLGLSQDRIANILDVHQTTISRVLCKQTWKVA